ncbi:MAG: DoxX family membrane protein [Candidatus Harrisonbacteria bacterium]|nr:DoxX family membrane protein [Candidatus Harrisonbacteria bacterium]
MRFLIPYKYLLLRLGLAFVFLYAGLGGLTNPDAWIGFIPSWVSNFISLDVFLAIHAVIEIIVAILIIFNLFPKITYALATLFILGILLFYGIDEITFRDVAIFLLSLFLWTKAMEPKKEFGPAQID